MSLGISPSHQPSLLVEDWSQLKVLCSWTQSHHLLQMHNSQYSHGHENSSGESVSVPCCAPKSARLELCPRGPWLWHSPSQQTLHRAQRSDPFCDFFPSQRSPGVADVHTRWPHFLRPATIPPATTAHHLHVWIASQQEGKSWVFSKFLFRRPQYFIKTPRLFRLTAGHPCNRFISISSSFRIFPLGLQRQTQTRGSLHRGHSVFPWSRN